MLRRFSLYGFLKNQRYFEPFLYLFFLERGLSFFEIGLLVGFREVCINLMEVPSGALADLYGRRRAMMLSFVSYIASFATFGLSPSFGWLMLAMLFFAVGDSFRTGTHKAMIFDWLEREGRIDEKTRVYGFTRSWSKIGSAVSVVLAAALVFYTGSYAHIFWFSIPPYLLNLINFAGYPRYLDGPRDQAFSGRAVLDHFREGLRLTSRRPGLRRLIAESTGFEGVFAAVKDYLQPVLQQTALALPFLVGMMAERRSALLIGAVYFVLHLASSVASRQSHRVAERARGEERASGWLWLGYGGAFGLLTLGLWVDASPLVIACFVALFVAQNLWRPLLVSRIDDHAPAAQGATILSIESQAKSVATMVLAPLLGLLVDAVGFWPVGAVGLLVALGMGAGFYRRRGAHPPAASPDA